MHATLKTFGYPDTVLHEGEHWSVLLRPKQATLGALVLVSNSEALRYSDLPAAAHAEQHRLIGAVERALEAAFGYDKINYLMLMMVDPHVHFHVLPRYAQPRTFAGTDFQDEGWPALPVLGSGVDLTPALRDQLKAELLRHWRV